MSLNEIVEGVLSAIGHTFDFTQGNKEYLDRIDPSSQDSNNPTRRIDRIAQQNLKTSLQAAFGGDNIAFVAEEPDEDQNAVPADLVENEVEVAILDPVDGTDLWARGFGNWCISTAIFDPVDARIRAAFVGYNSGDIYWATRDGAFRHDVDGQIHSLYVERPDNLSLKNAAVCFYGQKPANFLAVQENWHFLELLRDMQKEKERAERVGEDAPKFRIYNLGGNPMMVRMTEKAGAKAAVDAVFELKGQKPYDVVPGAFIAQRAGAWLVDLSNKPINLHDALRYHTKPMRYVLAATGSLADELVSALTYEPKDEDQAKGEAL